MKNGTPVLSEESNSKRKNELTEENDLKLLN